MAAPTSGRGTGGRRQRIPRPPEARAGAPAPWDRLAPERRRGIGLDRVRAAMGRMGPAQPWPAPYGRVPAAVLVPLFEEDGESRVILTRRSDRLRSHTGEVSFPGGRLDPGEAPVAAALREAGEEIGLSPASVEILGQLPPLATVSSRSSITPFVGVLAAGRPTLRPNPAEVDLAFDVSLAHLAADGVHREERWHRPELAEGPELAHRVVHFFELADDTVWGATARILHQFLELVLLDAP